MIKEKSRGTEEMGLAKEGGGWFGGKSGGLEMGVDCGVRGGEEE